MSSREFLVLVRHLDDDSEFKKLAPHPYGRDGDWPEAVKIAAKTHEELALNRASKYVGSEYEYIPQVFIPPKERPAVAMQAAAEAQEDADGSALLGEAFRAAGWS